MRKVKTVLSAIMIIFLIFLIVELRSPVQQIRDYNEDWGIGAITYLQLYRTLMPKAAFNELMHELIVDNMDIPSLNVVALYIVTENVSDYIPLLQQKCNSFETFPKDSSWVVEIKPGYFRESSIGELSFSNSLCNVLGGKSVAHFFYNYPIIYVSFGPIPMSKQMVL